MYEKYHLEHYSFSDPKANRPVPGNILEKILAGDLPETEQISVENFLLLKDTSYHLVGSADLLPFRPQRPEEKAALLTVQSFAHMNSPAGYDTRRSQNDSWQLIYTHAGCGVMHYEDRKVTLQKGDLLWIDCREPSYYYTEGEYWEHSDLHLGCGSMEYLYREFRQEHFILASRKAAESYEVLLDELLALYCSVQKYRGIKLSHHIERLLLTLICDPSEDPEESTGAMEETLRYLVQYMQKHYDQDLSLDFLSRFSGISKYHLVREFHRYTGFPPNEYLLQLRMERAAFLLKNTAMTVRRVGASVGIENEAYFSRLFRKRFGQTPGQFRKA